MKQVLLGLMVSGLAAWPGLAALKPGDAAPDFPPRLHWPATHLTFPGVVVAEGAGGGLFLSLGIHPRVRH